jgi:hypothetical protein
MALWRRRKAASAGEDNGEEKPKAGKDGIFRRYRRIVTPKLVKSENVHMASLVRDAFRVERPPCPDCEAHGRHGRLLPVPESDNMRRCDTCDLTITLHDVANAAEPVFYAPEKRRQFFLRRATGYFLLTCLLLSCGVLYGAWRGSWMIFIFALIYSMPLLMSVFAMRYRAWQVANNRLFERTAPFGDFLRDEMRGLFAKNAR